MVNENSIDVVMAIDRANSVTKIGMYMNKTALKLISKFNDGDGINVFGFSFMIRTQNTPMIISLIQQEQKQNLLWSRNLLQNILSWSLITAVKRALGTINL